MNPIMTSEMELDERVSRAVENFMAGYGCCQSVVAAFADLYGLDDELAKKIAAGFGGGVGRLRMMCGAVSGIVMLTGLDCGQTEGSDGRATWLRPAPPSTTRSDPAPPRWRARPASSPTT